MTGDYPNTIEARLEIGEICQLIARYAGMIEREPHYAASVLERLTELTALYDKLAAQQKVWSDADNNRTAA